MPGMLAGLLDAQSFIPHGHCYLWKPNLVGLHLVSDALIALAYYSIPLTLAQFVRKRVDLPYAWIIWFFTAFIVACGTTHLVAVWTLWYPIYWVSGLLKLVTAIVSIYTALVLLPLVPKLLAVPSSAQLEAANQELQREIRERKQAEKQLELQDVIVRTMAEGICLVRAEDGVIVYTNPKFEKLFGYEATELVGQPVSMLNDSDADLGTAEIAHEILTTIGAYGEYSYEVRNIRKDGMSFWSQATTSRFNHPEHGVVHVVAHADITERKALEQELAYKQCLLEQKLAQQQQLLDTFMTSAPVGMCVLDRQMRYTLINEALASMNGHSAAAHIGKSLERMVPDLAAKQVPVIQQVLASGTPVLDLELVGETPKQPGVKRTWLVSHFPIREQPAAAEAPTDAVKAMAVKAMAVKAMSVGIVSTEITDRKQAEEQLKGSLREKEVLLQEIHHRVKNNLQIIDGLLKMQYRRTSDRAAAAILLESQHRIKSIALVHEKLYRSDDLAKIDFSQYVTNLVGSLLDSYQVNSDVLAVTIDVDDIALDIDTAIPCGLIINELVSNSLKYAFPMQMAETDSGEGDLVRQCRKGSCRLQISVHPSAESNPAPPSFLILTVQDNGVGIPETVDLQNTRSLGLKLVQGLVAQLEGHIDIDRQAGTLFRITFPQH